MIGEWTEVRLDEAIESEYDNCVNNHGSFKNWHEAYAVMLEEMEEVQDAAEVFDGKAMKNIDALWLLIKDDATEGAEEHIKAIYDTAEELCKECIQVMAVCRKSNDLIERENGK